MRYVNQQIEDTTARIQERSVSSRALYLSRINEAGKHWPRRHQLGCTNIAHGLAAAPGSDKFMLRQERLPNIGIVTSYNDMLSAHSPYARYPDLIKQFARQHNAVAQVAGGTPAMCDGITQGCDSMELSLFSRDLIAMSTAVALSHGTMDAAMYLGICDKIVPGLLIGALRFGFLPGIFVPSGPMASGISNSDKAKVRQRYAEGKATRDELLESELAAYHDIGTCTFYGTANSNQILMEFLGLHVPGAAFVSPLGGLRDKLTEAAVETVLKLTPLAGDYMPLGKIVDEKAIVNAMVGLMATGGSTNHTIHLVAIARAAGIQITWDDFNDLSSAVPLITSIYPSGQADINQFHAAGGVGTIISQLLDARLLHEQVETVSGPGLANYACEPTLQNESLHWKPSPQPGAADDIIRSVEQPFRTEGGLKLLSGNLGRAVSKVSAIAEAHQHVTAPCRIFLTQEQMLTAFSNGELDEDVIVVVRFQGPAMNGMPELHKLMTPLASLQDRGFKVALVTDGRLSGASGKVPSAIHVCPEAMNGGPIAKLKDGDLIDLNCRTGMLTAEIPEPEWAARSAATPDQPRDVEFGSGRELFSIFRKSVSSAEEGAVSFDTEC